MTRGFLMIDVAGLTLAPEDFDVLSHPAVGGLILFKRNFENKKQVAKLIADIRNVRPSILIAVDQEGGRVQRFQQDFTRLPPMADFGKIYEKNSEQAKSMATECASVLAKELREVDVDFSFAPVVDLDKGFNTVIGDRAFHRNKTIVYELADAFIQGLHAQGMKAVIKHFPGHGHVNLDSHFALPVDDRTYAEIEGDDLFPFEALIKKNVDALMPAHILFPKVDTVPVGFSKKWLNDILREKLNFKGVIFSDDLSMVGAHQIGGIIERVMAASAAGCDMILICNDRKSVNEALADSRILSIPLNNPRLQAMAAIKKTEEATLCNTHWDN